ncbi:unnamed protein product [Leptidea sinapis]|uniref:Uncharacterized protein n=1 Tax=Leptidea sinapis TaxID=189913 RepID=A0A5E4PYL6_9NEOP|nr:unnamed protein product [Leptidea sinapis]
MPYPPLAMVLVRKSSPTNITEQPSLTSAPFIFIKTLPQLPTSAYTNYLYINLSIHTWDQNLYRQVFFGNIQ